MSFIIAIHVGDGLVFASDSRITYSHTSTKENGSKIIEQGIHFTDSSPKTFLTPSNVGISYCGDSSIQNKPITGYIEQFIDEHKEGDVDVIANEIIPFFTSIENGINTQFLIGGYKNEGDSIKQKLYYVNTRTKEVSEQNTSIQNAIWSGETDVMIRILNPVYKKSEDGQYNEIVSHPVLWHYFTLQDAIDFARYAVRTTIETMNFQSRVKTVGGAIDILVIKPNESIWIQKRKLE